MKLPEPNRKYLPNNFDISEREDIASYYDKLLSMDINTSDDLESFILQTDELDRYLSENMAIRYINNSCDTTNSDIKARYLKFITDIIPKRTLSNNLINQKTVSNQQAVQDLIQKDPRYSITFRNIKNDLDLFREQNIDLNTQDSELSDKYGEITSQQTVTFDGQENMPLSKLSSYIESNDEAIRKSAREIYRSRRFQDNDSMIDIMSQLISIRQQIAKNTAFDNFTKYKFIAKNRFDYTQNDVDDFHKTAENIIKPTLMNIYAQKTKIMGKEKLNHWDIDFDPLGSEPLKPYNDSDEMTQKTIYILSKLDPQFGQNLQNMYDRGLMDLDSRVGKQNGGYNYPLEESRLAFIFMNNSNTQRDLETMVHEAGHAMHGFVIHDAGLDFSGFTNYPTEVAEVASMSMELFTAEHRDIFYPDRKNYLRARIKHLESIIRYLCHEAAVDNLQKNIYNTNITGPELNNLAKDIYYKFKYDDKYIDRTGYEEYQKIERQKQLHIFEIPFYYIEYAIAQLGAIAMRKNYLLDPQQGIKNYKAFLASGNTKTIPEIFAAGNIKFDMSAQYIGELMDFVTMKIDEYYTELGKL